MKYILSLMLFFCGAVSAAPQLNNILVMVNDYSTGTETTFADCRVIMESQGVPAETFLNANCRDSLVHKLDHGIEYTERDMSYYRVDLYDVSGSHHWQHCFQTYRRTLTDFFQMNTTIIFDCEVPRLRMLDRRKK